MKFKKKVERAEYWTTSRTLCDRCKKPVKNGGDGTRDEVEILARLGDAWPEGDFRNTTETDCCVECWETAVVPALVALGFTFTEQGTEDGPDYYNMQEDPEVQR